MGLLRHPVTFLSLKILILFRKWSSKGGDIKINRHLVTSIKKKKHKTSSDKLQPELDPVFKGWARARRQPMFHHYFLLHVSD